MDPIKHLDELERRAELGGGEDRLKKQHDAGKMTARERIEFLFDPGTFLETDKLVTHRCRDFGMDDPDLLIPGDGVVAGSGRIDGRPRSGLAAVSIADIVVRGITKAGMRMMAILEGPDRKSFAAKGQDTLLDGAIRGIDAGGVVFVDQAGQEIRKTMRPIGEVIR